MSIHFIPGMKEKMEAWQQKIGSIPCLIRREIDECLTEDAEFEIIEPKQLPEIPKQDKN